MVGPPGTGKTTTISHAVRQWTASLKRVWLVAQSNVGVKNIAESLKSRGVEFRLIVSKEFYVEWFVLFPTNNPSTVVDLILGMNIFTKTSKALLSIWIHS